MRNTHSHAQTLDTHTHTLTHTHTHTLDTLTLSRTHTHTHSHAHTRTHTLDTLTHTHSRSHRCTHTHTALSRTINTPLTEKSATLKAYTKHLEEVHKERSLYKTVCDQCRETIRSLFTQDNKFTPPPLHARTQPNSVHIESHYSFNYTQQVSICVVMNNEQNNTNVCVQTTLTILNFLAVSTGTLSQQPSAITTHYFLTPRKCALFGVKCEAIPRQVNFLCDESGSCGKGANVVVSQLHYYFENHGLGEILDTCKPQCVHKALVHKLTFLNLYLQVRRRCICMQTIVLAKTRTTPWSSTCCGGQ